MYIISSKKILLYYKDIYKICILYTMLYSCISIQFALLYVFPSNGFLVAKMRHKFNALSRIKYSRDHKSYKASRRAVVPFYKA